MTRPGFNVLVEPWVPVVFLDGTQAELGLLPCLEQAHHIAEIRDPSPIVEFGLYRLLVAFVLDTLALAGRRPADHYDLDDLIVERSFDAELLNRYAESCGDVFDLFDPEKPFLQTAMAASDRIEPLAGMYPVVPSGTSVVHWHHQPERHWKVTPSEAARLLTTVAPFMTAGGRGRSPSINGAPGIYVLPAGRNLFETTILNLPLRMDQESGDGRVAWRSTGSPCRERSEATTAEALTWRPRRIQLIPDVQDDGECAAVFVSRMRFGQGDSTRFTWIDANLAYRYDSDRITPVRMRENRSLWRDAGPLFLVNDLEHGRGESRVAFKRPDVVQAAFLIEMDGLPSRIQAYAMRTDMKMKVFEWARAVWRVPPALGRSTRLGAVASEEMERAERGAWALKKSIRALYPTRNSPPTEGLAGLATRCERSYWQGLEAEFASLLGEIAGLGPDAPDAPELVRAATRDWRGAIEALAIQQFEAAAKDMDSDGEALKRAVEARGRLVGNLRRLLW